MALGYDRVTLQDLGNLGEFVGAVAVVVSLIYLAYQIRQNTRQLDQNTEVVRAEAELHNARLAADFNARVSDDPELVELWRLGTRDSGDLTESQRIRFGFLMGDLFYRLEGLFRQYDRGFLGEESWRAWERLLAGLLAGSLVRSWWETEQHPFSASFRAHVDGLIPSRRESGASHEPLEEERR